MNYKDFSEQAKSIIEEVGKVSESGMVGRHSTYISIYDEDSGEDFEVVSVEPDYALGCGCWTGISISIRKKRPPAQEGRKM